MKKTPRLIVQVILLDCDDQDFQLMRGPVVELKGGRILPAVTESLSAALTRHGVEIPLADSEA